jgi:hypothetical protein
MKTYDYKCFGYFYKLNNNIPCRKYLDIRRNDLAEKQQSDLILVMLNPGSCDNNEEWEKEIEVDPDATLYRIITFLESKSYNSARIINLSDIQQKDSREFFKKRKELEQINMGEHSIFHESRLLELSETVSKSTPVLFACGTNKKSKDLTNKAICYFTNNDIQILNSNDKHYHPLMRPINGRSKWLDIVTAYAHGK